MDTKVFVYMKTIEHVNDETCKHVNVITHSGEPPARVVRMWQCLVPWQGRTPDELGQSAECPVALKRKWHR
jgi:hypothetical protein